MKGKYEQVFRSKSLATNSYALNEGYQDDEDNSPRLLCPNKFDTDIRDNCLRVLGGAVDYIATALKILRKGHHLSILNWNDFRGLIAEIFVLKGFRVYLRSRYYSNGIHLIVEKDHPITGLEKYIVTIKKCSTVEKVTQKSLIKLNSFATKSGASKVGIITLGLFGDQISQFIANHKLKIFALDYFQLCSELKMLRSSRKN